MIRQMDEVELRKRAWQALLDSLGPVEAMRFLSMMRSAPRDYQTWRDERFRDLTAQGLVEQLSKPAVDAPE